MEEIMLSIIVATYNHEKYISKALDSILMQKVNFKYEVLIGEDCSTDNTAKVLKEYEKKVGDNFHFFYREKNTYKNLDVYPLGNFGDLKLRSVGKYLIILEGDDYWTDENKLQKEVDFLEANPSYAGVAHNCILVDENNNTITNKSYPSIESGDYEIRYLISNILPGQTATFLYRNPFVQFKGNFQMLDFITNPLYGMGDRRNVFFVATMGKIHVLSDYMSCYRYITNGGTSFSSTNKREFSKEYPHYKSYYDFCLKNDVNNEFTKCSEIMLYFFLIKSLFRKKIKYREFRNYKKSIKHRFYCFISFIIFCVRKKIFRMKFAY